MANKTSNQKSKSGLTALAVRLAVLGLCAYFMVGLVMGQMQISANEQQLGEVTAQLENQQQMNQALHDLIESDDRAAFVERVARDRLGYVWPDERIFVDLGE